LVASSTLLNSRALSDAPDVLQSGRHTERRVGVLRVVGEDRLQRQQALVNLREFLIVMVALREDLQREDRRPDVIEV
jgi:hypothetical protein